MKKYFFILISIFSFFFLCSVSDVVYAIDDPMSFEVKQADQYDNRIVEIVVSKYQGYARSLRVTELVACEGELTDCQKYERAKNSQVDHSNDFLRPVGEALIVSIPYNIGGADINIDYTFQTESDGEIFLLIECLNGSGSIMTGTVQDYAFAAYKLSTINQRIVINADDSGKPTYSYDNIQYTPARNNRINIELYPSEYVTYNGEVYVCEYENMADSHCVKYTISENTINYFIFSPNDGEKVINFYLIKHGHIIAGDNFNESNSTKLSKKIILDTVGPKITLKGGQWVFVKAGSKYVEQQATCKDATFSDDVCKVSNDLNIVRIDYTSNNYQLITYSATDRLGNTSSEVVKIKVEIITTDNSGVIALLISAGVIAVTFTILGMLVYKNHLKKKKLSYI